MLDQSSNATSNATSPEQIAMSFNYDNIFGADNFSIEENSAKDHAEVLLKYLPQNGDGLSPESEPITVIESEASEESGMLMDGVTNEAGREQNTAFLSNDGIFGDDNLSIEENSAQDFSHGEEKLSFPTEEDQELVILSENESSEEDYASSIGGEQEIIDNSASELSFNSSNISQSYFDFFSGCDSGSRLNSNDDSQIEAQCGYSLIDVVSAAQDGEWDFVLAKLAANPLSPENSRYYEEVLKEAVIKGEFELVQKLIANRVSVQLVIEGYNADLPALEQQIMEFVIVKSSPVNASITDITEQPMSSAASSGSSPILSPISSISFASARHSVFTAKGEDQTVLEPLPSVDEDEAKRIWACK